MPIDLSQIKKKINPPPDGQDVVRLRTGVITAVNANGTVNLTLSGVTMTNVPRLTGAVVFVGQAVQVASYRGSMLVLGAVASTANGGQGLGATNGNGSTSNSAAISGTETAVLVVTATNPYRAGRAYRITASFQFALNTANNRPVFKFRQNFVNSGTPGVEIYASATPAITTSMTNGEFSHIFRVAAGGSDLTSSITLTAAVSAGTVTVLGLPRMIMDVEDIGRDIDYPYAIALT